MVMRLPLVHAQFRYVAPGHLPSSPLNHLPRIQPTPSRRRLEGLPECRQGDGIRSGVNVWQSTKAEQRAVGEDYAVEKRPQTGKQ